jgi:hypothetical protein
MPESGISRCVQWSLLQQQGRLRYLGPGMMMKTWQLLQAIRMGLRLVTVAAMVTLRTTTMQFSLLIVRIILIIFSSDHGDF